MEAVVIDAGSRLLKAGTAVPEQVPPVIIPTRMKQMVEEEQQVDNTLFEEIAVDPVVRGVIKDWDAMEDLLQYVLYTGLEWVEGNEDIASVLEGAVHHIASRRFEIGGIDLTRLLAEELGKSNPLVNISMSDVETIKERFACCTEDEDSYGKRLDESEEHTLPDGQVIRIGRERYTVGEALFQPSILGVEAHGIVEQLVHSISTVSSEHQKQLLENTVLCGGITKMPGFEDRFQREALLSTSSIRPSLVKPPEYMPDRSTEYSAWIGGAILAKVVFPQNQHLTKGEYDETGPSVVHRKCF